MSQVAISGNASGTGTLTIAAPNTNSNYTLTLPAATGTVASIASVNNNGVVYANSSGQPTTGTAFVFDGTNVGIGTSSPSQKLQVLATNSTGFAGAAIQNQNTNVGIAGVQFSSDTTYFKSAIGQVRNDANGVGALVFYNASSTGATNWATSDERMRIDSSGNLLVGTTSYGGAASARFVSQNDGSTGACAVFNNTEAGTGSSTTVQFRRNATLVGTIAITGSATAYNTSSDYRLKENIQPMQNALGVVTQLKPVTYKWKADDSDGQGFIAHELQAVVPDCVTGEKDAVDAEGNPVYQGIDTSFLVATLTAAIQEQQALIQQLQADVAELKGATP